MFLSATRSTAKIKSGEITNGLKVTYVLIFYLNVMKHMLGALES
jgi:hypothetical protein